MKTVKISLCLIVAFLLNLSCTEYPERPLKIDEGFDYQELNIAVNLPGESFKVYEGSSFALIGNTSCNLADNTCVSITGILRNLENGNYEVKSGTLRILSEETGCYLTGDFNGLGKNYFTSDITMAAIVDLNCGIGVFETNGGELELKMTGMDSNGNLQAEIHGMLKRIKKSS